MSGATRHARRGAVSERRCGRPGVDEREPGSRSASPAVRRRPRTDLQRPLGLAGPCSRAAVRTCPPVTTACSRSSTRRHRCVRLVVDAPATVPGPARPPSRPHRRSSPPPPDAASPSAATRWRRRPPRATRSSTTSRALTRPSTSGSSPCRRARTASRHGGRWSSSPTAPSPSPSPRMWYTANVVLLREDLVDYQEDPDPSWNVCSASPPLDYSTGDTRVSWCWVGTFPGCDCSFGAAARPRGPGTST